MVSSPLSNNLTIEDVLNLNEMAGRTRRKEDIVLTTIAARGYEMDAETRDHLEDRFRKAVGDWSKRIRRASVYLQDVNGPKGGRDRRCSIEARLLGRGVVVAIGTGTNFDTSLRLAARRLVRRLREIFRRTRRKAAIQAARTALNQGLARGLERDLRRQRRAAFYQQAFALWPGGSFGSGLWRF